MSFRLKSYNIAYLKPNINKRGKILCRSKIIFHHSELPHRTRSPRYRTKWFVFIPHKNDLIGLFCRGRGQVAVCAGTKRVQMSVWFTGAWGRHGRARRPPADGCGRDHTTPGPRPLLSTIGFTWQAAQLDHSPVYMTLSPKLLSTLLRLLLLKAMVSFWGRASQDVLPYFT